MLKRLTDGEIAFYIMRFDKREKLVGIEAFIIKALFKALLL
jgi:hypothetical protein